MVAQDIDKEKNHCDRTLAKGPNQTGKSCHEAPIQFASKVLSLDEDEISDIHVSKTRRDTLLISASKVVNTLPYSRRNSCYHLFVQILLILNVPPLPTRLMTFSIPPIPI